MSSLLLNSICILQDFYIVTVVPTLKPVTHFQLNVLPCEFLLWIIVHWFYEIHSTKLDHPRKGGLGGMGVINSIHAQRSSALKRGEFASSCSLTAPFIQQPCSCQPCLAFSVWSVWGAFFSIIQPCPQRIKGLEIMTQIEERVPDIETERLIDIIHRRSK